MTLRVLIPAEDSDGKIVAAHFGRAPYFTVIDMDDFHTIVSQNVHANTGTHRGGKGHAHDNVLQFKPHAIIVSGMGPRGIRSFQDAKVAVLRADAADVESVLESYVKGKLPELTEGCSDAHHK